MKSKAVQSKARKRVNLQRSPVDSEKVILTGREESEFKLLFEVGGKYYMILFTNYGACELRCMGESICIIEIRDDVLRDLVRFVHREWTHIL